MSSTAAGTTVLGLRLASLTNIIGEQDKATTSVKLQSYQSGGLADLEYIYAAIFL